MFVERSHHFHFRLSDTRELGALSLMLAIVYFGEGLVSVFIPIYFWNLGFPICFAIAGLLTTFFAFAAKTESAIANS